MAKLDFEENIRRLDEIIAAIEGADMSLEASLALYKEGVTLAEACGKTLDAVEKEVMILTKSGAGVVETRPFVRKGGNDGV